MVCKFCGNEIEEGSKICNHCAKPVPEVYKNLTKEEYEKINNTAEINELKVQEGQTQKNNGSLKTEHQKKEKQKTLGYFSIIALILGFCIAKLDQSIVGAVLMVLGLIGTVRYLPSANSVPSTEELKKQYKDKSPEEILKIEQEINEKNLKHLQEKRKKNIKTSKTCAIWSIILNCIGGIPVSICKISIFKELSQSNWSLCEIEISQIPILRDYWVVFILSCICTLVGIVLAAIADDLYGKNKLSNVAITVSIVLATITGLELATLGLVVVIDCINCIESCPG